MSKHYNDCNNPEHMEKYIWLMNKTLIPDIQEYLTDNGYSQSEVYATYEADDTYPQFLNLYVVCANLPSVSYSQREEYQIVISRMVADWIDKNYGDWDSIYEDEAKEEDDKLVLYIGLDWIDFSDDDLEENYHTHKSKTLREADEEHNLDDIQDLDGDTIYIKVSSTRTYRQHGKDTITRWLNVKDYASWQEFVDDLEEAGLDVSNEDSLFIKDWRCYNFDIDNIAKYSVREFIESIILSDIRNNEESWTYLCAFMEAKKDFDEFLDLAQSWENEWYKDYVLYPNMSVEKFGEQYVTEMFAGTRYFDDIMKELEDFIDWDAYGQNIIDKGDAYNTSYGIFEYLGW